MPSFTLALLWLAEPRPSGFGINLDKIDMKLILTLLAGTLFGAGLVLSGMTDPSKVLGFLDFTGEWDPALAFVMGGALLTFGLGLLLAKRTTLALPDTSADPVSKRLLIGSAVFGIGWGLSGFCPGPALANIITGERAVLLFIVAMLLGMRLAQRIFRLDQ